MFSIMEKVFSKIYSRFPISAIFGEFGVNFFATFARSKSMGMLFNLRGLEKMFSFIEKFFSKIYSHFTISATFREFRVKFL